VEAFAAALEAGAFLHLENRVELARGEVIAMPMDGARHISGAHKLMMAWAPAIATDPTLAARIALYTPGSVRLTPTGSARAPDALLCPPGIYEREHRWPEARECLLAIEFADTSLRYDEAEKRPDYAAAGLPELWIVRLPRQDVRVCREPQADGSWAYERLVAGAELLSPLAAPELAIPAAALFAQ
jgi:Uma2 family endonuclease